MFGQNSFDDMVFKHKYVQYYIEASLLNNNEENNVELNVQITFPENYFNKNAIIKVTPQIKNKRKFQQETYIGKAVNNTGKFEVISYNSEKTLQFVRRFNGTVGSNISVTIITQIELDGENKKITKSEKIIKINEIGNNTRNTDNTENIDNTIDTTKISENINNTSDNDDEQVKVPEDIPEYDLSVEELSNLIKKNKGDDKKIAVLNEKLGDLYRSQGNYKKSLKAYKEAILYKEKTNDPVGKADVYTDMGKLNFKSNKNALAIENYTEAVKYYENEGETKRAEITYSNMGTVYSSMMLYENAIDSYTEALNKTDKNDNISGAKYKSKIADTYYKMNKLEETIKYYEEAIKHEENEENESELITSYNNAAIVYSEYGDTKKANNYIDKAIKLNKKSGNTKKEALLYNNRGNINFRAGNYDESLSDYNKSLNLRKKTDTSRGKAITLHNIGNINFKKNNKIKAEQHFKASNKIAEPQSYNDIISKNYFMLSELLLAETNCTETFNLYKNYLNLSHAKIEPDKNPISEFSNKYIIDRSKKELIDELSRKKAELLQQTELADERKLKNKLLEVENQMKEIENKRQENQILSLLVGIVLILIFAVIVAIQYNDKKKANNKLTVQNAQILMQKEEIQTQADELHLANDELTVQRQKMENKNKKITSSLYYAEHIQKALLPNTDYLKKVLDEYFVFYKPRDIVSGDFYWVNEISKDEVIVIAADCTGHGVPGAMMSMLGISLLNEIVNDISVSKADEILNILRDKIIDSLNKNKKEKERITRDGMDLALIKINKKKKKLEYAGANNHLIIVRNKKILDYKPDYMPIGAYIITKPFKKQIIDIIDGDMLYIFSDGYADQFGKKTRKKFFSKRLNLFLLKISGEPLEKQRQILEDTFYRWKGDLRQMDDILIFGIRV